MFCQTKTAMRKALHVQTLADILSIDPSAEEMIMMVSTSAVVADNCPALKPGTSTVQSVAT
jgi:hypothetical protein